MPKLRDYGTTQPGNLSPRGKLGTSGKSLPPGTARSERNQGTTRAQGRAPRVDLETGPFNPGLPIPTGLNSPRRSQK